MPHEDKNYDGSLVAVTSRENDLLGLLLVQKGLRKHHRDG